MKKRILFVSMIVATSLVMMFVSCKKENQPQVLKGCNCNLVENDGGSYPTAFSMDQMQLAYNVTDCNSLATAIRIDGGFMSVTCTGTY